MLNLQTKFGQKATLVGNWLLSLVSINFVWFVFSMPALLMLVLLQSLPLNGVYLATWLLLVLMLAVLVLPATYGVFQAAAQWAHDRGSHYWRPTLHGYIAGLKQWRQNSVFAGLIGLWLIAEQIGGRQVFWQSSLLILGVALIAAVILGMLRGLGPQAVAQALQQPLKLLAATLLTLALLLVNLALPLLFCIVLMSVSLSAWAVIKIMKF